MKDIINAVAIGLVVIILLSFGGLLYYKFFAPKWEDARREVFEKTRSYNQAKLQELAKYKLEYELAKGGDKKALASVIKHRFADYQGKLPYGLKQFLKEIRGY